MTPEQQRSIVKTLQAALTTVEEKWNGLDKRNYNGAKLVLYI